MMVSSDIVFYLSTFILSLIFFIMCYTIANKYKENSTDINKLLNERTHEETINHFNELSKDEPKLIKFIRSTIVKANIQNSVITVKSMIGVSIIFAIIGMYLSKGTFSFVQCILIGIFTGALPCTILFLYAEKMGDKINEYFVDFLNLIQNHLEIKDDINNAIANATKPRYKIGMLKKFAEEYDFDIGHGETTQEALRKFSCKVDNGQIKDLCNTLIMCSKTSGMYLLVVRRYTANYVELYDKLIERKTGAKKKRMEMFGVIVVGIILLFATSISKKEMFETLQSTMIGQVLVCLVIISFMYIFFLAISIGRFEFD